MKKLRFTPPHPVNLYSVPECEICLLRPRRFVCASGDPVTNLTEEVKTDEEYSPFNPW